MIPGEVPYVPVNPIDAFAKIIRLFLLVKTVLEGYR